METKVALPDDVLADVLRRLPSRSLVEARCVCKVCCAIVDVSQLLLLHVLPHSVHDIFLNYVDYYRQHFFTRPASATALWIDGRLDFMPETNIGRLSSVRDHYNDLPPLQQRDGVILRGTSGSGITLSTSTLTLPCHGTTR